MMASHSLMPRCSAISSASVGWVVPEKTIIRFRVITSRTPWLSTTPPSPLATPLRTCRFLGLRRARAFVVTTDVALLGSFHAQGARRDVLGDHRSSPRPRALPDPDRRDQHVIRADVDLVSDDRPVLLEPVVVDGHGSGTHVRVSPDGRVADVGQ